MNSNNSEKEPNLNNNLDLPSNLTVNKDKDKQTSNINIVSEQKDQVSIDKVVVDLQHSAINTLNLFITVSLAFFISFIYRSIFQPFVEKTNLKYSYSKAEESRIESILAQLMAITRSDRVILFEFHNGDTTKAGRHLNKISATQEITGPGLTRVASRYQGLLISNFHTFLSNLEQQDFLRSAVDSIKDKYCKSHFIEHGVDFLITYGYFEVGIPLAIVQMQFCRNQKEDFDNFDPKEIDRLISELGFLIKREKKTWLGEIFKLFSRRII